MPKRLRLRHQWKSNDPAIPTGACSGTYGSKKDLNLAVNGSQTFDYTGNVQCAYLQKEGYYKLEVWGAQGGVVEYANYDIGGYGGYSYGNIYSEANSSLYIVIGNKGTSSVRYNGGGYTVYGNDSGASGGSGGGATHISAYNCGELKDCSSYNGKILIVAGGGGGRGRDGANQRGGGSGGGISGGTGVSSNSSHPGGTGGNQSTGGIKPGQFANNLENWGKTNGSFGLGGDGGSKASGYTLGGSGGGGWYGGGPAGANGSGGGGGSGYIGNPLLLSDKKMYCYTGNSATACGTSTTASTYTVGTSSTGHATTNAANTGNGYAKITYLGASI